MHINNGIDENWGFQQRLSQVSIKKVKASPTSRVRRIEHARSVREEDGGAQAGSVSFMQAHSNEYSSDFSSDENESTPIATLPLSNVRDVFEPGMHKVVRGAHRVLQHRRVFSFAPGDDIGREARSDQPLLEEQ